MSNISQIALTGWWPDCQLITSEESSGFECSGTQSSFEPVPLDPTGKTCYVNPFRKERDAVHWFGKDPTRQESNDDVFMYTVVIRYDVAEKFFPVDCENGVCSCDSIELLRQNWDKSGLICTAPLVGCARALADFEPNSCGAIASLSYNNPSDRMIYMFQANLQDLNGGSKIPLADVQQSVSSSARKNSFESNGGAWWAMFALALSLLRR